MFGKEYAVRQHGCVQSRTQPRNVRPPAGNCVPGWTECCMGIRTVWIRAAPVHGVSRRGGVSVFRQVRSVETSPEAHPWKWHLGCSSPSSTCPEEPVQEQQPPRGDWQLSRASVEGIDKRCCCCVSRFFNSPCGRRQFIVAVAFPSQRPPWWSCPTSPPCPGLPARLAA